MKLDDFAKHEMVKRCKLTKSEVLVLRLYTTAGYKTINNPLRDKDRLKRREAHPLPLMVFMLETGGPGDHNKGPRVAIDQAGPSSRRVRASPWCCSTSPTTADTILCVEAPRGRGGCVTEADVTKFTADNYKAKSLERPVSRASVDARTA